MRKIYLILSTALCILILSCNSSKKAAVTGEDKALAKALKKWNKNPADTELQTTVSLLYKDATQSHLDKISAYQTEESLEKWPKIVKEYEALQSLYDQVVSTGNSTRALKLTSFTRELMQAKQDGAAACYDYGTNQLAQHTRESGKEAYYAFRSANNLIPGFRDSKQQMNNAFQNSIVKVVINPVRDNSFYYSTMGNNTFGNSFNNDNFQRNLVNDLGGNNNRTTPAKFYTDWEARRANINPDWIVDITWLDLDVPQPYTNQYSRTVSKQIENGRDTSGHAFYQTVSATVYVTRQYFTARGDMELRITDAQEGSTILSNRFGDSYDWQQETATYRGDSRALSSSDWAMINNRSYVRMPRKDDILNELYRKIYPQVRNQIYNTVSW